MEEFQAWLTNKLLSLESDDSVITDYINGILTGDESQPEKQEALEGILCGIMVSFELQTSDGQDRLINFHCTPFRIPTSPGMKSYIQAHALSLLSYQQN